VCVSTIVEEATSALVSRRRLIARAPPHWFIACHSCCFNCEVDERFLPLLFGRVIGGSSDLEDEWKQGDRKMSQADGHVRDA
jgi:hypothetical protein